MVNHKNMAWKITFQQTVEVIQCFGTHKCVPYAHAGKRPIHLPVRFQFAEQSACTVYEKRKA